MYSAPLTHAVLSRLYGTEKKELTVRIRAEKQAGRLIQRMVHRDPVIEREKGRISNPARQP